MTPENQNVPVCGLAGANCSAGLVLRLRSIADDECQNDEWMADVLRQSADKIERMERAALSSLKIKDEPRGPNTKQS